MDWKSKASGEMEEEILQPSVRMNEEQELLEYVASVLVYIETFWSKTLSDHETKLWRDRLLKYPKWKLDKLGDYSGRLEGIFDYLDRITRVEDHFIKPKYEPSGVVRECGCKLFKGVSLILNDDSIIDKQAARKELHEKLQAEYPQFSRFLEYIE